MKNLFNFFGVIAIAALTVFSMAACDDGSSSSSLSGPKVPDVNSRPAFPSNSNPAATKAAAEQVLEELQQSWALQELRWEIDEFIDDYIYYELDGDYDKNFNFSNKTIPGANIKLTASKTESETGTGGFKTLNALYDSFDWDSYDWHEYDDAWDEYKAARDKIQFSVNDKNKYSYQSNGKAEVTPDKTINGITIASGSTFQELDSYNGEESVAKAGTYKTAQFNESESGKYQLVIACTVTASSGSIKIVLGLAENYSYSEKNDSYKETEKYSGSLKIYGDNNALLINFPVKSWQDWKEALTMIGYRDYEDYDDWSVTSDNSSARSASPAQERDLHAAFRRAWATGPKR